MEVRSVEETKIKLQSIIEEMDLKTIQEAAAHVLNDYRSYDHQGSDTSFLAYCEEIVDGNG